MKRNKKINDILEFARSGEVLKREI